MNQILPIFRSKVDQKRYEKEKNEHNASNGKTEPKKVNTKNKESGKKRTPTDKNIVNPQMNKHKKVSDSEESKDSEVIDVKVEVPNVKQEIPEKPVQVQQDKAVKPVVNHTNEAPKIEANLNEPVKIENDVNHKSDEVEQQVQPVMEPPVEVTQDPQGVSEVKLESGSDNQQESDNLAPVNSFPVAENRLAEENSQKDQPNHSDMTPNVE